MAAAARNDPFAAADEVLGYAAQLARRHIAGLARWPVATGVTPQAMAVALDEPLPEQGMDAAAVLADWLSRAEAGIVNSAGPRFFGFVNGGATPAAVAGDWLASAIDQNAGFTCGQ